VLIDNFVITHEEDSAGGLRAAQPGGADTALPAAEPVGGSPGPAPAAADPEVPDADGRELGGTASPVVDLAAAGFPVAESADRRLVQLGLGEETLERFVGDYLQMLDDRLDSIRRCLDGSDVEGARVAVLSLESSSAMLGGDVLAARLGELRHQLGRGLATDWNASMSLIETAALAFRTDLEAVPG
jgi:hypothetical protein